MKLGTTSHPKFLRLKRKLSTSTFSTVGLLESIWMMAAQFTDDGDLSRFDAEDIAAYVDWPDDPSQLIEALVACGWLDQHGDRLCVHDFADHAPHFVTDRLRKREQRAAKRASQAACPKTVQDSPGTEAESLSESDLVKPSLAQPSQSKSNKAPSGSRSEQPLSDFRFHIKAKGGGTWALPIAKLDEYVDTFGSRKWVEAELRKARQWCTDNATKRKTSVGMLPFLTRWLTNANDSGRSRPSLRVDDELPEMQPRFSRPGKSKVVA
ncbi:MAG: hypothetical protein NXI28_19890 [bacterium]|nr:hypothetical protein [bacterium]